MNPQDIAGHLKSLLKVTGFRNPANEKEDTNCHCAICPAETCLKTFNRINIDICLIEEPG
jgi:hypothetical protein